MNGIVNRRGGVGTRDCMKEYSDRVKVRWPREQRAFVATSVAIVSVMLVVLCCESRDILAPDMQVTVVVLHPNETVRDARIDKAFQYTTHHNTTGDWLLVIGHDEYMEESREQLRPLLDHYARHTYNQTLPYDFDLCLSALHVVWESVLVMHPTLRWRINVIVSEFDAPLFRAFAESVNKQYRTPWHWNVMGAPNSNVDAATLREFISMM